MEESTFEHPLERLLIKRTAEFDELVSMKLSYAFHEEIESLFWKQSRSSAHIKQKALFLLTVDCFMKLLHQ
jgi:GGDEF domain-containing protein